MTRRLIDISMPIDSQIITDPPVTQPTVTYMDHRSTVPQITSFFSGLRPDDLPDGEAWAVEIVNMTTHSGTHLDAPYHFHSTMNKGERAWTIDEVPLEWCCQPGVKLDLRHLEDGAVATPADLERALDKIDHRLAPLEIVLINTRAGECYGKDEYLNAGCGIGREATLYLLERGVRVTGTDAWSWDAPFVHTAARYAASRDPSIIWEGHKASREIGYCHLEKLNGLEQLPGDGFQVICFPVKIKGASAGWTRAVALIEES